MPMQYIVPAPQVAITPMELESSQEVNPYQPIPDEVEAPTSQLGTNIFAHRLDQYLGQKNEENKQQPT